MKKCRMLCCLLALFSLGACAAGQPSAASVEASDLLHQRFTLSRVNGEAFSSEFRVPSIEFGEDMMIFGQICNNYRGKGEIEEGRLFVRHAASTMMLCPDQALNDLEHKLFTLLREGAAIRLDADQLVLEGNGLQLDFERNDYRR